MNRIKLAKRDRLLNSQDQPIIVSEEIQCKIAVVCVFFLLKPQQYMYTSGGLKGHRYFLIIHS